MSLYYPKISLSDYLSKSNLLMSIIDHHNHNCNHKSNCLSFLIDHQYWSANGLSLAKLLSSEFRLPFKTSACGILYHGTVHRLSCNLEPRHPLRTWRHYMPWQNCFQFASSLPWSLRLILSLHRIDDGCLRASERSLAKVWKHLCPDNSREQ